MEHLSLVPIFNSARLNFAPFIYDDGLECKIKKLNILNEKGFHDVLFQIK